jgi:NitT/TauT family transport system substrate-binding protein
VALEHGLFEKAGVTVQYDPAFRNSEQFQNPLDRAKEKLFEERSADTYNLCEWGGIDRLERSERGGRIGALRAAILAQAVVSFDKKLQNPRDLANVEIGINDFTGSHYTTLQAIAGAVGREHVKLVHAGGPAHRYELLKAGKIRAVALMEPYISLALKEGAHIIAVTFYRGAEVVASDLSDEQRGAYFKAINEAVDLINADFARYRHHITNAVEGRLSPEELGRQFVRWEHVEPYDPETFGQAYSFMQSWGLSDGRNDHGKLVAA